MDAQTLDQNAEALARVIEAAGGPVKLAELLGMKNYQAIQRWREIGRVPAERVLSVEAALGIPRSQIRPDLYQNNSTRKRS